MATLLHTSTGYYFKHLDYDEVKLLEVGDEICIGVWQDEAHKKLELIPATVTRAAFFNADADEPDWEIETTNGFSDIYSVYTKPER